MNEESMSSIKNNSLSIFFSYYFYYLFVYITKNSSKKEIVIELINIVHYLKKIIID